MACNATFKIRSQGGTFPYRGLDCESALQLIREISADSKDFTVVDASIETRKGFFFKTFPP